MNQYYLVFLGGGLGSVCRFFLGTLNRQFPYGTALANILGCFVLGLLLGFLMKQTNTPFWFYLAAVGFCGGFTTFSGFSGESLALLEKAEYLNFLIYAFGSLAIGILAVFIGVLLTKF